MLNISLWNLLFTVLNLLILFALMKKFLYRPVLGIIAKRQEMIDDQFAKAKASGEEAQALKQQYETCLSEAKAEQEKLIREAKLQAGAESERILADADKTAKQMIADAKSAGLAQKEKTIREADAEIAELAMAAAVKIVAECTGEKSDSAIYEEFLKTTDADRNKACGKGDSVICEEFLKTTDVDMSKKCGESDSVIREKALSKVGEENGSGSREGCSNA